MMTTIRSLAELQVISQSREGKDKNYQADYFNTLVEDSGQRKRYIRSKDEKALSLPNVPKRTMRKWSRTKDVLSRFFEDLDYASQIQSSYDLTLIADQSKINDKEAA